MIQIVDDIPETTENTCCRCGEIKASVQKYQYFCAKVPIGAVLGECGLCSDCAEEFEQDSAKD